MLSFLLSLILTIVIEFFIIWLILRKDPKITLLYVSLINLLTQPLANFAFIYFGMNFLLLEVLVFLVEIILIKILFRLGYQKSILLSFAANAVTALISLLFI
ncbi:MAG: hypothetical protein KKC05_00405 [Nanoarchaeota archaeon]|nr:hypothetical protein [Nanoarchaeota archaeon]